LPFKYNLQRYTMGKDGWDLAAAVEKVKAKAVASGDSVGRCTLNQVDP
jgi:hypothetical protein